MAYAIPNTIGEQRATAPASGRRSIYHLFPGRAEHHIPAMLQFFRRIHADLNTRLEDHVFAFYGADPAQLVKYRGCVPGNIRTVSIERSKAALFKFLGEPGRGDALILHSGFYSWLWLSLLAKPRLWKRTAWIMWGADIDGRDTLRGWLYRKIKGLVVPRLGAVSALVPGDFDRLQRMIGPCKNYIRAFYSPLYEEASGPADDVEFAKDPATTRIILGNSAWEQSEHVEALEWLARFGGENIEVVCPLGYPHESAYKTSVIEKGAVLLGEKFRPLRHMLDWNRYHELLRRSDILVLNNRNQQGLGNIYFMLLTGKKVFLRGDSPTYPLLQDLGFAIYDARDLHRMPYAEVLKFDEADAERNKALFQEHLSTQASIGSWSALLQKIGAVEASA